MSLYKPIADDLDLERRAVQIEPDAGGAARSVVGDDELATRRSSGSGCAGADGDRVARPEMNQPEERPAAIERQLEAAAAGVGPGAGLVQDDGAVLLFGGLQPQRQRERIGAAERPHAGMDDRVVAAESQRAGRGAT